MHMGLSKKKFANNKCLKKENLKQLYLFGEQTNFSVLHGYNWNYEHMHNKIIAYS